MKRVMIVAGESSGDLHGSMLMNKMKAHEQGCEFKGIGGSMMIDEGLEPVRHCKDMNFMGFFEVIHHLPFIRRAMRDLESMLDSWQPHLVILIDYPGFNLTFASRVKKRKIPLMYYISPQIWAWHKSRVKTIQKYVDRMVVIFKFEQEFYRTHGVNAYFVGHPLLDIVHPTHGREEFRNSLNVTSDSHLIGFLPGSRPQEIERILPVMMASCPLIRDKLGSVTFVLGMAPDIDDSLYHQHLGGTDIIPLRGKSYDIMAHADALVVTSGTATLESGIFGTPMVIVYRTSLPTYLVGRSLVKVQHIGMINIVARERIVPELWQNDVTPLNIAEHIFELCHSSVKREKIKFALAAAKEKLREPGASERAACIALDMMN